MAAMPFNEHLLTILLNKMFKLMTKDLTIVSLRGATCIMTKRGGFGSVAAYRQEKENTPILKDAAKSTLTIPNH